MRLNIFKRQSASVEDIPGVVRIRLDTQRLSAANAELLRERYLPAVAGQQSVVLVLDQLSFIDSSGLGLLVGLRNAMPAPQKMVLEGINDPTVLELLKLTRMDQIFAITADADQTHRLLSAV